MSEKCPYCGLAYDELRTGETFASIKDMLWVEDEDSSKWRYKRRNTVLGFWHALKLEMWRAHLGYCEQNAEREAEGGGGVPF